MKEKIITVALDLIGDKGAKFTTDDIAKELGTSKRTIYKYFESKEDLIDEVIDYVFMEINRVDKLIIEDETIESVKKLEMIFTSLPKGISLNRLIIHMEALEKFYPTIYEKVKKRMNEIWDLAIKLLNEAIAHDVVVPINTAVLRVMLVDSLKRISEPTFLEQNQMSFEEALKAMTDMLMFGILNRH